MPYTKTQFGRTLEITKQEYLEIKQKEYLKVERQKECAIKLYEMKHNDSIMIRQLAEERKYFNFINGIQLPDLPKIVNKGSIEKLRRIL